MAMHTRQFCGSLFALVGLTAWSAGHGSPPFQATNTPRNDRDVLWNVIHGPCATAALHDAYPPNPCIEVTSSQGSTSAYAVFKDRNGRYQYLVLPLARIAGIESPALLAPDAPNYFADAWTARLYVEAALHQARPRDELSLVVNSAYGRSQDQLHIHVDCIRSDVHDVLHRLLPSLTGQWRPLPETLPPHHHAYQAIWVGGETLSINPFKSLAAALPAGDRMGLHSLIVVGAYAQTGQPGFVLLSGRVDRGANDRGSGDELQDLSCAIATHSRP
jgi:CDP-diacylglycerol pyrophosphatase